LARSEELQLSTRGHVFREPGTQGTGDGWLATSLESEGFDVDPKKPALTICVSYSHAQSQTTDGDKRRSKSR
jgi:hypothetical protein